MFALLVVRPGVLTPTQRSAPLARAFSLRMMSSSSAGAGAAGGGGGNNNKLRVVTYNILTPHYATPRDLPVRLVFCDAFRFRVLGIWMDLFASRQLHPLTHHPSTPTTQLHPPALLEERPRLDKVLAKLRAETAQGSVIALQEVSRGWAGHLHTFFARAGYHFVHCAFVAGGAVRVGPLVGYGTGWRRTDGHLSN